LLIACLAAASCGGGQLNPPPADPACTHPCDLAQSIQVDIVGAEPAASVTVTEPCSGGVADCGPGGCRMVNVYLSGSSLAPGDATLVCHLTAVAPSGQVVERDLTATYTSSFCCSGYELSSRTLDIDISASDAAIGGGPGDAAGT